MRSSALFGPVEGELARVRHLIFEPDGARLKINPLACWTPEDVRDYMDNNRLPRHPLVAKIIHAYDADDEAVA